MLYKTNATIFPQNKDNLNKFKKACLKKEGGYN